MQSSVYDITPTLTRRSRVRKQLRLLFPIPPIQVITDRRVQLVISQKNEANHLSRLEIKEIFREADLTSKGRGTG